MSAKKRISILGSTGSIGQNTVDLLLRARESFDVVALTANENVDLLARQAVDLSAKIAVVANPDKFEALKDALTGTGIEVAAGREAVIDAASLQADWVMAAIVGAAGLAPTMKAIEQGATIGLANKESLVCAGALVLKGVRESGSTLLPVDSEHNAIFQVFDFARPGGVSKIVLTASGGPFRTRERHSLVGVTPEEAVKHPNWNMGAKISVDSATMMNKGLELIEAFHLFPVNEQQIDILVHPQSVIHSMVEYCDGSVLAQLGSPDMRTPIAYCLAWPERMEAPVKRLDLAEIGRLEFEEPDMDRFPALKLARDALRSGGRAPAVLNASNEIAVEAFLNKQIGFLDIANVVDEVLNAIPNADMNSLDDVYDCDAMARRQAAASIKALV